MDNLHSISMYLQGLYRTPPPTPPHVENIGKHTSKNKNVNFKAHHPKLFHSNRINKAKIFEVKLCVFADCEKNPEDISVRACVWRACCVYMYCSDSSSTVHWFCSETQFCSACPQVLVGVDSFSSFSNSPDFCFQFGSTLAVVA